MSDGRFCQFDCSRHVVDKQLLAGPLVEYRAPHVGLEPVEMRPELSKILSGLNMASHCGRVSRRSGRKVDQPLDVVRLHRTMEEEKCVSFLG